MIRTVPKEEWREFLARFSRIHNGWVVTIHGSWRSEAVASTRGWLEQVSLHGDALQIDLVDGSRVYVARPVELRVQERADGAEWALETENDDGAVMRAAFRATALPEEVDGVTAGEAGEPPH